VPTVHVVGAAIVHANRCLIAQRSHTMALPLKWEFPGGKLEPNETPQAALVREIREELGVTISVGSLLGNGSAQAGSKPIALDVYAATLVTGTPVAREHAQLRWVTANELLAFDWAEADVPIIGPVRAWLLQQSSGPEAPE